MYEFEKEVESKLKKKFKDNGFEVVTHCFIEDTHENEIIVETFKRCKSEDGMPMLEHITLSIFNNGSEIDYIVDEMFNSTIIELNSTIQS